MDSAITTEKRYLDIPPEMRVRLDNILHKGETYIDVIDRLLVRDDPWCDTDNPEDMCSPEDAALIRKMCEEDREIMERI